MDNEVIDVVDEKGVVLRTTTRGDAYKKGVLHPAVNILVFNSKGEVFLQQRSKSKSAFPLYWDISASEHLKSGESYKEAATRGLKEELRITGIAIRLIRTKHLQKSKYYKGKQVIREHELVELYGTNYDGKIEIDEDEVAEGRFISVEELKKIDKNKFTPWGLDEIEYLLKNPKIIENLLRA